MAVARQLDLFHEDGKRACLLNMLAAPGAAEGPFAGLIRTAKAALIVR